MRGIDFDMLKIVAGGAATVVGLFEVSLALRDPKELTKKWKGSDFFHNRVRYSDYNRRQFLAEGLIGVLFGVPLLLLGLI